MQWHFIAEGEKREDISNQESISTEVKIMTSEETKAKLIFEKMINGNTTEVREYKDGRKNLVNVTQKLEEDQTTGGDTGNKDLKKIS